MRDGDFPFIDQEEVFALAEELDPGDGYHIIGYERELIDHVQCVSCWCSPCLVFKDKDKKTEIWAHRQSIDNPQ